MTPWYTAGVHRKKTGVGDGTAIYHGRLSSESLPTWLSRFVQVDVKRDRGHFRLEQVGDTFNIVATEVRGANGTWTTQASLFDARITIPTQERSAYEMLRTIFDAVGAANHAQLNLHDDRLCSFSDFRTERVARK